MADTARLGRKLMRLKQRIARETDPARSRKLRKAEVQTMLELDQPRQAAGLADKLAADFPDWPAGWALLGDLRCRLARWDAAEEAFSRAVELREAAGMDAAWLRQGPLYLLAEARGDHGRCLELAGTGTDTGRVLRFRALRLLERDGRPPRAGTAEPLAGRLLLLERAWRGADPRIMPPALEGWEDEPEWRWRFVVEGVELFGRAGLTPSPWKKALRAFDAPVADPRYASERKSLEKLL
jgi:tetratricopeptide (TPR) repeat protein